MKKEDDSPIIQKINDTKEKKSGIKVLQDYKYLSKKQNVPEGDFGVLSSRGDNNDDLELDLEFDDSFNENMAKKTISFPLTARIAEKEKNYTLSPR